LELSLYNIDPLLIDTDSEGYNDSIEVAKGSDPGDPLSVPKLTYNNNFEKIND
jgi:hypothetical protein